MVAKQRQLEPYKAYLLGLVHDMGKITLYSELSSQFRNNSSKTHTIEPSYASFVPLMETLSPALSHTIAQDWQLPDEICLALEQQITIAPQQQISAYALLLFQANLACELYFSLCQASDEDRPILQRSAQKALTELSMPNTLFDTLDTLMVQV
jgi:HD-like signal output (HDOD) protein